MKEHLNDYEKRIWEGIDKDAEEIADEWKRIQRQCLRSRVKKWIGKSTR